LREVFGYTDAGLARDWQIVRLAALLHDVGHPPYSHAAEHLLPAKTPENYALFQGLTKPVEHYAHEDYSVAIIDTLLKDLIEEHPDNRRNYKIKTDEITALISKRPPSGATLFWKDIISGQLDADRMDYLLRDSLHAGVSYGRFDLDRIVSSVCAVRRPQEESMEPKIAIMKGGIYAAEALIIARYWMHKQVYFHKTRVACDYHLQEALGEILRKQAGNRQEAVYFPRPDTVDGLKEYSEWDDYRVMGLLAAGDGGEHGRRLMTRNHYRLVCELEEADATITQLGASIKKNDEIVKALGATVKLVRKPTALWYKTNPASELILIENDGKTEIGILSEHSALMRSINVGYLRFVYADKADAMAARAKLRSIVEQISRPASPPIGEAAENAAVQDMNTDLRNNSPQLVLEPPKPTVKTAPRESETEKGIQDVI
jgi:HD superfamily phosphohydrolase